MSRHMRPAVASRPGRCPSSWPPVPADEGLPVGAGRGLVDVAKAGRQVARRTLWSVLLRQIFRIAHEGHVEPRRRELNAHDLRRDGRVQRVGVRKRHGGGLAEKVKADALEVEQPALRHPEHVVRLSHARQAELDAQAQRYAVAPAARTFPTKTRRQESSREAASISTASHRAVARET